MEHFVYRQDVLAFVTTSVKTCLLLERIDEYEQRDFLYEITQQLPMLYAQAHALPLPKQESDGYVERFVTEDDYNYIVEGVKRQLGTNDAYLEVFLQDMKYNDEPLTAYISENIADIYQELKDMAYSFQTEQEEVMNDGLLACLEAFREHWGQKLLNVMRALHALWIELGENSSLDEGK